MAWTAFIVAVIILAAAVGALAGLLVRRVESAPAAGQQEAVGWPLPILVLGLSLLMLAASLLLLWSLNLRGTLGV